MRLEQRWRKATGDLSGADMWEAWRLDQDSGIPGVVLRAPRRDRALMRTAPYFRDEPLPRTDVLVKHSIWGWRPGEDAVTASTARKGHSFDSIREKGTFFPARWSDQDIADAIVTTIEEPEWKRAKAERRFAVKEVNGVFVEVQWTVDEGKAEPFSSYPMFGHGVEGYDKGKRVPMEEVNARRLSKYDRL